MNCDPEGNISKLPIKKKNSSVLEEYFNYLFIV